MRYLVGLFNSDEALEYLRGELGVSDESADDLVQSVEEEIRDVVARFVRKLP